MRVGCDIVDLARFRAVLDRRDGMRDRVFTAREQADARRGGVAAGSAVELARLAARFAAKEATRKALGDLRLAFHATEVLTGEDGAPRLWLHGAPSDLSVSMSHDGGVAMAVVVGPPAATTSTRPPLDLLEPDRRDRRDPPPDPTASSSVPDTSAKPTSPDPNG